MQLCAQDLVTPEIFLNSLPLLSERLSCERSALAAEVLRGSGRLRLQVHGESMLPAIWPRAVVEIASCSVEDVKQGEVVLAMRDGRLFLHRFVGRERDGFVLRGDSMPGSDPIFQDAALIGKLVSGSAAPVYCTFPFGVLYRAIGRIFCYCGLVRRVALSFHQRWKMWREQQEAGVRQTVHLEA